MPGPAPKVPAPKRKPAPSGGLLRSSSVGAGHAALEAKIAKLEEENARMARSIAKGHDDPGPGHDDPGPGVWQDLIATLEQALPS